MRWSLQIGSVGQEEFCRHSETSEVISPEKRACVDQSDQLPACQLFENWKLPTLRMARESTGTADGSSFFAPRISDVLSSVLKIEHYPRWRMVAGVYLATRPSVYTTVREPDRQIR
jgi:hypothetical protein